jgi:osmotically-inducible protein OsmY
MSAKMQTKSDSQIQQEVLREMKWDTRVEENEIGVAVEQGVVTLTGEVGSYGKKIAAQEAAHRVFGVLDVANDIQVRLPGSMARAIPKSPSRQSALEWDVGSRSCASNDGLKWLRDPRRNVDLLREREMPSAPIALAGVRAVTNKIEVRPSKLAADDLEAIEDALERRAEREARRIRVEVHDNKVTLSGSVRSWAEKRAILGTVSHAPGVRAVEENLFVDPLF